MQKINFQDLPNTTTPINSTNLNLMQTNVEDAFKNTQTTSTSDTYCCDYLNGSIVETGSNTNGTYIKYGNGIMICTKKIATAITNWVYWNGWYEGSVSGGNFAQQFIESPTISVTNMGAGGAVFESALSVSASGYGTLYFNRPNEQGSTAVTVSIIAIGKWK